MAGNNRDYPLGGLPDASNPTQEFPTQEFGAPAGAHWPPPSHPSAPGYPMPAYPLPGQPDPARPGRTRRTVGLVSAGVAGASLLVIGLGGGYLIGVGSGDTQPNVANVSTMGQAQIGQAPAQPTPTESPAPEPPSAVTAPGGTGPGLSSTTIALGAAVGTVSAINGASFTVQGLDGVTCHVITTNSTRVATLRGSGGVRNLSVGDPVMVKGAGGADGSIVADLVIAGAFPDLGAGTS